MEAFFTQHWTIVALLFGVLWSTLLSVLVGRYKDVLRKQEEAMERIEQLEKVAVISKDIPDKLDGLTREVNRLALALEHRLTATETEICVLKNRVKENG